MLVQLNKLKGSALDWAAAQALKIQVTICTPNEYPHLVRYTADISTSWSPSSNASQCAYIIDAKKISTVYQPNMELTGGVTGAWAAFTDKFSTFGGDRPQAVLRALVGEHFGTFLNIPDELLDRSDLCG